MAQRIQDRLFQLDEGKNELVRLNSVSYSELELYENTNLHEWLAKEIKSLGEDLLVIQREHTAVKETQRRPDIVALDGSGRVGGAGHKHLISTMEYRIWYGRGEGRNVNEYMPWMHHIRPSFNDHLKQEKSMSLITGAGRSGLDPIAKWSLIFAPILFIVGGSMTADFGSYKDSLVGDIAANGDTAKLGLTLGIIGVALYVRSILGLTRITPEAGNAQARMRVASAGAVALLAILTVQSGMAMGIAGGVTSGAASFLGVQTAGTIVALLTVIPLAGGLAAGGLVSKYFGWVLLALAVVGLITVLAIGLDTEIGGLINGVLQGVWGIVILVIGIIMINGDGD